MPTLKEAAILAKQVYNEAHPLPEGWRILYSSKDDAYIKAAAHFGYFANVYLNEQKNEIAIVHRGTRLGLNNLEVAHDSAGNITDDSSILTQKIPFETESAINFTNRVKKT